MPQKKKPVSKATPEKVRAAMQEASQEERAGLFPPHIDKIREFTALEFEPGDEDSYSALLESICGAADDSQPVEQYDGTLGVPIAFVNAHQSPAGQLQWNDDLATIYTNPGTVSGVRWCTGTLISNDLFLTAGHCFDQTGGGWVRPTDNASGATIPPADIATNMHVNFNYQVDPSGNLRTEQSFPILSLEEYRLGGLDFAIVRLGGNPGATFGTTAVSTTDAAVNDMLCIIGHPAGWPKRIEAGPATSFAGDRIRYNDIDTLGGNSGSGILRANDGQIVGVHTNGGCNAAGTGENSGVRITSIIAQSPILQGLTAPTLKFADDGVVATVKFTDDGGTHKFIDDGGTLKFIDDGGTTKFSDDGGTIKFVDDGGTIKFVDDGGTHKFVDDGGTLKHVDDVKLPAMDKRTSDHKLPISDGRFQPPWRGRFGRETGGPRAVPFILSTPHHSMAWAGTQASPHAAEAQLLDHYEAAITQLGSLLQQAMEQVSEMEAEYRQLVQEYEELAGQGR